MKTTAVFIQVLSILVIVVLLGACASTRCPSTLQGSAKESATKNPNSPEYWVECGRGSLYSRDGKDAEQAFRRAIDLDWNFLPAYKHLGLLLVSAKRPAEAEKIYLQALKLNERDSELLTGYGYCLSAMGLPDRALKTFYKSAEANSNQVAVISALLGASGILEKRGDRQGADREYAEALKINPDIAKTLNKKPLSSRMELTENPHEKNPGLKVDLRTDRGDGIYAVGESISLVFKTNKECRVRIVMLMEGGEEKLLYPNQYQRDAVLLPGRVYKAPDGEARYVLRVKGPAGKAIIRMEAAEPDPPGWKAMENKAENVITITEKR
jgi:Tfp pilus assembly protein PilF